MLSHDILIINNKQGERECMLHPELFMANDIVSSGDNVQNWTRGICFSVSDSATCIVGGIGVVVEPVGIQDMVSCSVVYHVEVIESLSIRDRCLEPSDSYNHDGGFACVSIAI